MANLWLRHYALAVFLIAALGSSSGQIIQSNSDHGGATAGQNPRNPDAPALQERHPRYQVMPSDVLAVTFPLSPEINQSVTVQPDGFITLANVGSVYVQGETISQIVADLTKAYANILHSPIIAVDLTSFQAPQFTVNGQVGKPGQYPLRIDTTVLEGIAVAGGLLPAAKTQVFLFHRVSIDWVEVKKLNLKPLLNGRNINEDVHLQPGDMIFVPDKFIASFRKYVPYAFGLGTGLSFNGTNLF
jgi:protein involved in polysaccharide export with SLBB domain